MNKLGATQMLIFVSLVIVVVNLSVASATLDLSKIIEDIFTKALATTTTTTTTTPKPIKTTTTTTMKPTESPETNLKCGMFRKKNEEKRVKDQAGFGEAPFLVFLDLKFQDDKNEHESFNSNCTGTIISRKHILTTYRCVEKFLLSESKLSKISARIGNNNLKFMEEIEVIRGVYHNEIVEENGDCEHAEKKRYGLAIIETKRMHFNLYDQVQGTSINNICMDTRREFDFETVKQRHLNKRYPLFHWDFMSPYDNCAKRTDIRVVDCNFETDKFLCLEDFGRLHKHDNFQEGAPIIEESKGKWNLIGVLTKDADLWGKCEGLHRNNPRFHVITLQDNVRWLNNNNNTYNNIEHDDE